MRRNPRNHPLGQIALVWEKVDGSAFTPTDVRDIEQTLDLWHGVIRSRFSLRGKRGEVTTACRPNEDTVVLRIESDLVAADEFAVKLVFPRGPGPKVKNTPGFDWERPESHTSELRTPQQVARHVSGLEYAVTLSRPAEASPIPPTFLVRGDRGARVLRTRRPERGGARSRFTCRRTARFSWRCRSCSAAGMAHRAGIPASRATARGS